MKYLNSLIIVALSIFIGTIGLNAEEISQTYHFDTPTVKQVDGYNEICIPGTRNVGTPGEPLLPVKGVELLLPPGQCIGEVEIIPGERIALPGSFNIRPAEREYPLSFQGPFVPTPPNPGIYGSDKPYPGKLLRSYTTQSLCGYNIAILAIYPVEYIPAKGEVTYYSDLEVKITTTTSERSINATANFLRTTPHVQARVRRIVDNVEDISRYGFRDSMGDEEIDYVIITTEGLSASFETLREFKNRRGIRTVIKTIEEIYTEYSGIDDQDKIRNFIIDANQNWNTEYVLLGGDDNIIPHRGLYATAYTHVDNDIPADIYYGALDGNWNDDGDSRWGEPGEEDFYTEVFVGRAAIETATEADNFINKVIMYQQNPVINECTEALMVGELLWSWPWLTWGGDYKDEIKNGSDACGYTTVGFPEWFNVQTLYDRDLGYEWSAMNDLLPLLNNGVSIVNHLGHSWIDYVMRFYNYQVTDDNFTNNGTNHSFYIIYTQGCYPNAFDHEAISERFTGIQNGAVAFVGNTRYGWGEPGGTCGSSQYFDRQFFDALFGEDMYNIGQTNDDSKVDNIWVIDQGAIRWCYYQLCLLGDPQMPIWTNTPESLTVNHSPVCFIGSSQFEVTVPGVEGALVGLFKDGELLGRAYTDATGLAIVFFDIIPLSPGEMDVTVTAHNYRPYQAVVEVIPPEGPYVIYDSFEIDDSLGNNNGVVNPGETIAMSLTLKNVGIETAFNVSATLSTADSFVTISDSVQFFGNIDSSRIATSVGDYIFEVASTCPDQHVILFDLAITADGGYEWSSVFTVEVLASDIATSRDTLNFGEVYINYPESLALTVFNLGSETLNITDIYSDNSDFDVDISSFSLGGGESQNVMVGFSPSYEGMISGTLFIISDDPDEPIVTVALEGEGLIPPDILVTPGLLYDSLYTGNTSTQWLTISNTADPGASDLIFEIECVDSTGAGMAASFDGVDDWLELQDFTVPETFTVEMWTNPHSTDNQQCFIGKHTSGGSNIFLFGYWSGGFYVRIRSDAHAEGEKVTGFHHLAVVVEKITPSSSDVKVYKDGSLLWQTVLDDVIGNPSGKPWVMGQDWDSGSLTDFFDGDLDEVRIWNYGRTQSEIQCTMNTTLNGNEPGLVAYWHFDGANPWADISGNGNDGTPHGGVNTVESTAPIVGWLYVTPCSGTVPPASSKDIEVTFDATGLYGGDYFADIIITSNDPDEDTVTVPAHLHVTGAPDIAVSEDTLDYGIVYLGFSVTDTLIVSNIGTDLLTVSNIFSDNSDYTVDTTSFILDPEESQEVLVTFTPSTEGQILGTLTIGSDDPDTPIVTVFLQGESAEAPDISVTPDSLREDLGTDSISTQMLTIYNTAEPGASDLIFNISIEFNSQPDWLTVDPISDTIPAGSSSDISVTFDATGFYGGDYLADIIIISNDPDEDTVTVAAHLHVTGIEGLVGCWSFDEGSGNTAHDYSGHGNHGTIDGAEWVDGISGSALEIVDTDIVRFIPSSFDNSVTTGFSIACWVHWYGKNQYDRSSYIFDARDGSSGGFILAISGGGTAWLIVLKSGTDDPRVYSDSTVSDSTWTHVVGVFDYTSQTLRIFKDGKENGDTTATSPYNHTDLSAAMGNNRWAPGDHKWAPFNGILDEVRFYDRALSEAEIESLYCEDVVRGDANGDGVIDIADVMYLIDYLFTSGPAPDPLWVGDANCDGVVDIADVVYLINYLFMGGPPPCEGKETLSLRSGLELYKDKAPAQIGLSSPTISKGGILDVPVIAKFDVNVAAVQLEIEYDPEKITVLEPALTPRCKGLTIYSSSNKGIQKIDSLRSLQVGILDLSAKHYISAGTGALVTLRMKGSDLSSLEITKAILVDRDAHKIPVKIVSEMKKSEEVLIAGKSAVPQEFSLSQNYPNPFNPETEISYALPNACHVKLSIYNLLGQKIRTLVDEYQAAEHKTVHWDGKNEEGKQVASGVYFYRLEAGEFTAAKKMILLR